MADDFKASDRLFYAIAALPGWDELLQLAREFGGAERHSAGSILSSLLLASDDDREPIAVTGNLENGAGYLAIVYDRFITVMTVADATSRSTKPVARALRFAEVTSVTVETSHDFFEGTGNYPRDGRAILRISVAGLDLVFPPRPWLNNPLAQGPAAAEAYRVVRDAWTSN